jgi:hypothetical protein
MENISAINISGMNNLVLLLKLKNEIKKANIDASKGININDPEIQTLLKNIK